MTTPPTTSPLYAFERFDVGVVLLDDERRVVSMNDFARRVLPVETKQPFDKFVLSFHPERSQPKVEFMLDQAAQCPVANPPPMTMMISIGDIESRLDPNEFLRVHRGHIVALRSVLRLERVGARTQIVLDGVDTPVPVSRERVAELRTRLGLAGS